MQYEDVLVDKSILNAEHKYPGEPTKIEAKEIDPPEVSNRAFCQNSSLHARG